MSKLSYYTDYKKLAVFINKLWDAITLLEDRNETVSFLKDLLTPTEIRMLAKRLQVAYMLAQGYKYQDIKNFVRVTEQTVATVSNKLNYGEDGLIKILQRLEKIDKARQDKIEGKRNLLGQPPGLGKAAGDLAALGLAKIVRHHKKVSSIKNSK